MLHILAGPIATAMDDMVVLLPQIHSLYKRWFLYVSTIRMVLLTWQLICYKSLIIISLLWWFGSKKVERFNTTNLVMADA